MTAVREIVSKLLERALIPLIAGLGFTGAFVAVVTELVATLRD